MERAPPGALFVWLVRIRRSESSSLHDAIGKTGTKIPLARFPPQVIPDNTPRRCAMVNKDQVAGIAKQVKGSVKEAAGKATGNKQTQAEGKADKVAGKVQKAYGDLKSDIKKAL